MYVSSVVVLISSFIYFFKFWVFHFILLPVYLLKAGGVMGKIW